MGGKIMRFCPSCGTVNEDNARFCENCGTRLAEEPVTPQATPDMVTPQAAPDTDRIPNPDPVRYDGQPVWEEQIPEPKKPKTGGKLSILQIVVIAEAICLVAAVIGLFAVGTMKYSAESVAKRYFAAYTAHDWDTVYALLDMPEGDFMEESQFAEMMERSQLSDIANFKVRPASGSEDGIVRYFDVEYSVAGQGASSTQLSLVRQNQKSMFLFDTWKVSTEGMVSDGFEISVPAGAQASVDGIALTEDYLTAANQDGLDTYQLSLLNGVHSIEVAAPWCELYEGEFDPSTEGSLTVSEMTLTEAGEAALEAKMQTALETFYSSAMAGADYSEVQGLFAADAAEGFESDYNDLKERLANDPDDYYTLNGITFNNFQSDFYVDYGVISGEMEGDYVVDYTYTSTWFGNTETENRTSDSSFYMSASFVYEGDTYKLQYVSIPSVWW